MSNPAPSSVTAKVSWPSSSDRVMVARVAPAYLATFCRASSTQKYTAASWSCGAGDAVGFDRDREGGLAGLGGKRGGQALVGKERRVDPPGQVPKILQCFPRLDLE